MQEGDLLRKMVEHVNLELSCFSPLMVEVPMI